ncbi:MAG TPA: NAD(P)-dependent oxidoreductase [Methylomirabilota bacterium]|jgi:dTDP-4-dehydrorhamnose reductase|nr:NAD(P)-dependent oxidoreductase [Methylomirabilota bacterium]
MSQRVVVVGARGQLGRQLVDAFAAAGNAVVSVNRSQLDLADPAAGEVIASLEPEIVVNAAAWTDVDGCARSPERAMLLNGVAPGRMAGGAARAGALFVQISTNEVFDGSASAPYAEDGLPSPINPYGASKLAGERAVAEAAPRHLIVRTAWLFGPGGTNFVTKILAAADRALAGDTPLGVVADEWGNPTWTPALAAAIVGVTDAHVPGSIVHLAGSPAASRLEWATVALEGRREVRLEPTSRSAFPRASRVPPRAVLRPTPGLPRLTWGEETRAYVASLVEAASSAGPAR